MRVRKFADYPKSGHHPRCVVAAGDHRRSGPLLPAAGCRRVRTSDRWTGQCAESRRGAVGSGPSGNRFGVPARHDPRRWARRALIPSSPNANETCGGCRARLMSRVPVRIPSQDEGTTSSVRGSSPCRRNLWPLQRRARGASSRHPSARSP